MSVVSWGPASLECVMQSFTSGNLHYTFYDAGGWSEEKYYINIFDEKLGIGYAKILRPY